MKYSAEQYLDRPGISTNLRTKVAATAFGAGMFFVPACADHAPATSEASTTSVEEFMSSSPVRTQEGDCYGDKIVIEAQSIDDRPLVVRIEYTDTDTLVHGEGVVDTHINGLFPNNESSRHSAAANLGSNDAATFTLHHVDPKTKLEAKVWQDDSPLRHYPIDAQALCRM